MMYGISVRGCNYSTNFSIDLSDDEVKTALKLMNFCNEASVCSCQPTIIITKQKENGGIEKCKQAS